MTTLTYLDHAATTPVRPEVLEAMRPYVGDPAYANPASLHRAGQAARAVLLRARRELADALGTAPEHLVFTSGGTEADNLAILGAARRATQLGRPARVAVSAVEHKAVLEPAHLLASLGGTCIDVPVDAEGRLRADALDALFTGPDGPPALLSAMWVNNEIGVVNPVAELAARCREAGTAFHTDAVQAIGKVPVDLRALPDAMVTVSGHKLGAPVGVGALVLPDRGRVVPQIHGGGQQEGLRPGTENVAGVVALAAAVRLAVHEQGEEAARLAALRDELQARIVAAIPDVVVHGSAAPRAPHILSVNFPDADGTALLAQLDLDGVAVSGGSACTSGTVQLSHVLQALGVNACTAGATVRFSFGRSSTRADVERCVAVLPSAVARSRTLAGVLVRA